MTRNEVEKEYTILHGEIQNAGKFEFEPIYSPYFWSIYLEFGSYSENEDYVFLPITNEDREQFNSELKGYDYVKIESDNDGFVYCELITENEYYNLNYFSN